MSDLPIPAGLVRQMSFRSVLLAKLNLIVWAYGSKRKAARKMGVGMTNLFRWFRDEKHFLEMRNLVKVDEAYAVAFEKRCLHEAKLVKRRAKNRAPQPDMNFSVDAT